jgi:hypothetical protein
MARNDHVDLRKLDQYPSDCRDCADRRSSDPQHDPRQESREKPLRRQLRLLRRLHGVQRMQQQVCLRKTRRENVNRKNLF